MNSRTGSILLETLIVIPLYLLLLGGMLWLANIILAREKLVVADRYAAWNAGNRHRKAKGGIQGEIVNAMFDPNRVGDQQIQAITYQAYAAQDSTWSTPVGATTDLKIKMAIWTESWLRGSPTWTGTTPLPAESAFKGRKVPGQASLHALIMRTTFSTVDYRTPQWLPRELTPYDPWPWRDDVALAPRPGVADLSDVNPSFLGQVPSPPSPPHSGFLHTRFGRYVGWSR